MDLFDAAGARDRADKRPLPDRMRPDALEAVVGQDHLTGPDGILRRMIDAGTIRSVVLFGPPGTGKTTLARLLAAGAALAFVPLSAVETGVQDVRRAVQDARDRWKLHGQGTLVFLDEIHRFNRAQQDVLLPHVEDGTIVLVGATAENPWVSLNAALISRCLLLEVRPLDGRAVETVLRRAVVRRAEWAPTAVVRDEALTRIAARAGGDVRLALALLEWSTLTAPTDDTGVVTVTGEVVDRVWKEAPHYHDRAGDRHYRAASAFIKSLRASDPDAALFWFGQMLAGGEDPRFLARRLMIQAAEDVGLADPMALVLSVAAWTALEAVGLPEARIPLAEAVLYVASAPKSNSVVRALAAMDAEVARGPATVPEHLAPDQFPRRSTGYVYPHDAPGHFVDTWNLPADLAHEPYYNPDGQGAEADIGARLARWNESRRRRRQADAGDEGAKVR